MMIAGNESLDCEDLVSRERAEDVGNPQCLGVAMEYDIGPGNPAERDERLLLVSIPINIGSEQETVWRELRDADSSEESDRICRILVLDNRCYVDDMRDLFGVEEAENILPSNRKLSGFRERDDNAVIVASGREDSLNSARGIVRSPCGQRPVQKNNTILDRNCEFFLDPAFYVIP